MSNSEQAIIKKISSNLTLASNEEQDVIAEIFSNQVLDLDTINLDDEEELAKQQIMIKDNERLVLDEKATEVFEVMNQYNLPTENIVKALMEVLEVSQDSAKALYYKRKMGFI